MTTFKDIESAAERFHDVQLQEHLDKLDREDNRQQCVGELFNERKDDRDYRIDALLHVIDGASIEYVYDLLSGDGFERVTAKEELNCCVDNHIYKQCDKEVK